MITLEREGKEKLESASTSMEVQLKCMTEQCHRLTKELDETKERNGQLSHQVSVHTETETKVKEQLEVTTTDRDHLNNLVQDRYVG